MTDRLVAIPPAIKEHRLWEGSTQQLAFKYGGVKQSHVVELIARLRRCSDLTASERSWLAEWEKLQ